MVLDRNGSGGGNGGGGNNAAKAGNNAAAEGIKSNDASLTALEHQSIAALTLRGIEVHRAATSSYSSHAASEKTVPSAAAAAPSSSKGGSSSSSAAAAASPTNASSTPQQQQQQSILGLRRSRNAGGGGGGGSAVVGPKLPTALAQHEETICNFLAASAQSSWLSDVKFVCEDATLTASRLVLASASPKLLRQALRDDAECQQPESFILLPGVSSKDLATALELVYRGQTTLGTNSGIGGDDGARYRDCLRLVSSLGIPIEDLVVETKVPAVVTDKVTRGGVATDGKLLSNAADSTVAAVVDENVKSACKKSPSSSTAKEEDDDDDIKVEVCDVDDDDDDDDEDMENKLDRREDASSSAEMKSTAKVNSDPPIKKEAEQGDDDDDKKAVIIFQYDPEKGDASHVATATGKDIKLVSSATSKKASASASSPFPVVNPPSSSPSSISPPSSSSSPPVFTIDSASSSSSSSSSSPAASPLGDSGFQSAPDPSALIPSDASTSKERDGSVLYKCDLCQKRFRLMEFLKHQQVHKDDLPYTCPTVTCRLKFRTQSEFRTHRKMVHHKAPPPAPTAAAVSANASATSSSSSPSASSSSSPSMLPRLASATFYRNSAGSFVCPHCRKDYSHMSEMKAHLLKQHLDVLLKSRPALPAAPAVAPLLSSPVASVAPGSRPQQQQQPHHHQVMQLPKSVAKGVFTCKMCNTAHSSWDAFSKHFLRSHGSMPKILLKYKCVPCDLSLPSRADYLKHCADKHDLSPAAVSPPDLAAASLSSSSPLASGSSCLAKDQRMVKGNCGGVGLGAATGVNGLSSSSLKTPAAPVKLVFAAPASYLHSSSKDGPAAVPAPPPQTQQQPGLGPAKGPADSFAQLLPKQPASLHHPKQQQHSPSKASAAPPAAGVTPPKGPCKYCDLCKISFKSSKSYKRHVEQRHSTSGPKHACHLCQRVFRRSDNLNAHYRAVHFGVKPNRCARCSKTYRSKVELQKHLDVCSAAAPAATAAPQQQQQQHPRPPPQAATITVSAPLIPRLPTVPVPPPHLARLPTVPNPPVPPPPPSSNPKPPTLAQPTTQITTPAIVGSGGTIGVSVAPPPAADPAPSAPVLSIPEKDPMDDGESDIKMELDDPIGAACSSSSADADADASSWLDESMELLPSLQFDSDILGLEDTYGSLIPNL